MVLYFPSGRSSPCFVFQLKTICFFLCGHFMSTAATWATVWCKKQIQLWGGTLCRKACVPGYVYVLSEDIQTSVLSSDLLPVSNVNKAHCAGVCTCACEGPLTAPRSEKIQSTIRLRQSNTIAFSEPCPLWGCLPISHTAAAEAR